jgi:NDP-sugar pyrophosphorylase family protein
MNALIFAAGYATRLYPLTLNKAKPLLEVGGKPIIEWLLDNLADIPGLGTVYIVTNAKFASDFQNLGHGLSSSIGSVKGQSVGHQDHQRRIKERRR